MNISANDLAFVDGYLAKWFERGPLQPGEEVDEWFGRNNIDFNLHNYGGGPLRVDAYEVINDAVDTSYWVRVWTLGEDND